MCSLDHPTRCIAGAAVAALQLENSRLREEVDSLKRRLPALGLLRRTSSNMQLAGAATEQLLAEVAQVWQGMSGLPWPDGRLEATVAADCCSSRSGIRQTPGVVILDLLPCSLSAHTPSKRLPVIPAKWTRVM